jgi:hypothetical protein
MSLARMPVSDSITRVPAKNFLVGAQRANAQRQVVQRLAVKAAQTVEFGGQAGQAELIILKPAFNKVNVFGAVAFGHGFVRQHFINDVMRNGRPQQA